jgi:hypothetical protein
MPGYEALGWRTTAAALLVSLVVVGHLGVDACGMVFADRIEVEPVAALVTLAASVFLLLSMLLAAIFVLIWMHRAATNLHAFHRTGLELSPGWCVGYWFVPFANLYKPFQAMQEIWRASDPQAPNDDTDLPYQTWRASPTPGTLGAWWATYLIANVISNISARIDEQPLSSLAGFVGTLILAASAYLLIRIMRGVAGRQQEASRSLVGTGPAISAPPA